MTNEISKILQTKVQKTRHRYFDKIAYRIRVVLCLTTKSKLPVKTEITIHSVYTNFGLAWEMLITNIDGNNLKQSETFILRKKLPERHGQLKKKPKQHQKTCSHAHVSL